MKRGEGRACVAMRSLVETGLRTSTEASRCPRRTIAIYWLAAFAGFVKDNSND